MAAQGGRAGERLAQRKAQVLATALQVEDPHRLSAAEHQHAVTFERQEVVDLPACVEAEAGLTARWIPRVEPP